jgi:ribosome-associated protein
MDPIQGPGGNELSLPIRKRGFEKEIEFSASRSSGPGGQHVNKVSTRMELRFHVDASNLLDDGEKIRINSGLKRFISKDGTLILSNQDERSQYKNKVKVLETFFKLLEGALKPVKKRRATKPTSSSRIRRIESKKMLSEKKSRRKLPGNDGE